MEIVKEAMKVGKKFYSDYFGKEITVTKFINDINWYFTIEGNPNEYKAKTMLSYFEQRDSKK